MKKFLAIYAATAETLQHWNSMSQEEGQKGMEEWMQWQEANMASIIDPGNPSGKNTRITSAGAQDTPNEICGYTVMKGESKEEVQKVLASNPHIKTPGAYIELMEIVEM